MMKKKSNKNKKRKNKRKINKSKNKKFKTDGKLRTQSIESDHLIFNE
jgi:hypothetical protein